MTKIASAKINSFAPVAQQANVPPDDPILEIPLSEFQHLLEDLVSVYNNMTEIIRDADILRGRELARLTEDHSRAIKAEKSPTSKIMLINAYTKQLLIKIREALKTRPHDESKIVQVVSKVMARAVQIVDYVQTSLQQEPERKQIAFDSQQVRILFAGQGGEPVSRKETIRAMKRAEKLWPALACGHRPNDGRQTMRITAKKEDLQETPIIGYRSMWQRSDRRIGLSL